MNPRYKENILTLLTLLESKRTFTLPQLVSLHPAEVSERTLQRYIKELRGIYGFTFKQSAKGMVALMQDGYTTALSRFLKNYFAERVYPPVHGEIIEKHIYEALEKHSAPARLMQTILSAIRSSRNLTFHYRPQHPETRRKVASQKIRKAACDVPQGFISVTMLPVGLSFGGDLFLVLGETLRHEGECVLRQYAVRGMQKISIGAASSRQLVLNFNDVYADSIYTWIGGERYTLTLEDSRFDETPRIYSVNANGEEEALMFVSQALGRIKIINPPAALVAKAQELHLNADQLFRFTA